MHPNIKHILQFFVYEHLPEHLREVSKPFSDLAHGLAAFGLGGPELTVALRKLLESKDAAVRAKVGPSFAAHGPREKSIHGVRKRGVGGGPSEPGAGAGKTVRRSVPASPDPATDREA